MAHGAIFVIARHKNDVPEYWGEERYYDDGMYGYFVGTVADSVMQVDDKDLELYYEEFNRMPGLEYDPKDKSVKVIDKRQYFEQKFVTLKKAEKKLAEDATIEQFFGFDLIGDVYDIKKSYDEGLDYYVDDYDTEFGLETIDMFLRNMRNGDKFYLGPVTDYHY